MRSESDGVYAFGEFHLDVSERLLTRHDATVSLPPKAVDLLVLLLKNRGHLVTKEELMRQLWPDTFVEEANLSVNVSVLRRALTDGKDGQRFIETVPRRGYRFVAPVQLRSSGNIEEFPASRSGVYDTKPSTDARAALEISMPGAVRPEVPRLAPSSNRLTDQSIAVSSKRTAIVI